MISRRSNPQLPPAVVVGMDDLRGVYAARTLARHRVTVIGIAKNPKSYGARSRACRRIITSDTSGQALLDTLVTLGPQLDGRPIIVPCNDMSVVTLSRHRDHLSKWYALALPSVESVELLTDKVRFFTYAQQNNLPVPETRILYSREDAEKAAEELAFPCALKPPDSKSGRWLSKTHLKAMKVDDGADLLSFYDQFRPYAEALIVQQWIEGADEDHSTCNCYMNSDGQPLVTFVSRKLRQWPPLTGDGSLNEECRADDILKTTLQLFQNFEFHGLGEVEFKRDAVSSKQLIVEPNIGRATGRCGLAEGSGVELLYTMYCDLAGLPLPVQREQAYRGTKWVFLRRDMMSGFHYWRKGEISLLDWFRSLRGRKVYALFSWTDPVPFLADLVRAAFLVLFRNERRKRVWDSQSLKQ